MNKLEGITHGISIRQPWAWLIAAGWKDIENRSQHFKYRGAVAIHASKTRAPLDERYIALDLLLREITARSNAADFEEWEPVSKQFHSAVWDQEQAGAIIGVATIIGCVHEDDLTLPRASRWYFGPHGLLMSNPELFDEPIPWRGALGIWKLKGGATCID